MTRRFGRLFVAALLLGGSFAVPRAHATTWTNFVTVSDTMSLNQGRLCQAGDDSSELGCPTYAPYLTSGGLLGLGITPTVPLEVSGTVSATRFVGDGSGLTGVTAANSDRITSGTTSMVAISSTGFISVTQSGTNTAYFHPSLGLVAVGVSTTGPISGTSGYFNGTINVLGTQNYFGNTASTVNGGWSLGNFYTGNTSNADSGIRVIRGAWPTVNSQLNLGLRSDSSGIYRGIIGFSASSSAAENITITPNGSVGINTSSTAATLQVSGSFIVSSTGQNTTPSLYVTGGHVGIGVTSVGVQDSNSGIDMLGSIVSYGTNKDSSSGIFSLWHAMTSGAIPFISSQVTNYVNAANFDTAITLSTRKTLTNSEVMRLTSAGYVGIGTQSPTATLQVSGSFIVSSTGQNTTPSLYVSQTTGRIALGGTNPATTLDVNGSIRVSSTNAETCNGSNLGIIRRDPSTGHLQVCR